MRRGRRIVAARYLRTLATVETLIAFHRFSEAERVLTGIDQQEARDLAAEIERDDEPVVLQRRLVA